jgi:hypothetical protein
VSRAEELKRGSWWLLCRDSGKNEEGSGGPLRRRMEEKGGSGMAGGEETGPWRLAAVCPRRKWSDTWEKGVARGPAGKERKRKMGRAQRNSKLFFLFKIFQLMKGIWIFKFARFLICFKNLIRIHLNFTLAYLELMTSRFNF